MKKVYLLLTGLIMTFSLSAQNLLLDVPISPIDSLQDQSTFNNNVNFEGLQVIGFAQDENMVANSAIECGSRKWLEIDYSNFINLPIDTLSFYVKIIMEEFVSNPSFPFPTSGKGLIFGQEANLGLRYNYPDSTITDYDSLIAYKVLQPFGQWLSLRLTYYPDSTVELWVDNSLIGSAQRNTNMLLDTAGKMGLGLFDNQGYLHARVDSIRLLRGTPPIIVGLDGYKQKADLEISIYPNPTKGQINIEVDPLMMGKRYRLLNLSGQSELEGKFTKVKNQIELEQLSKGVYFLTVPELGATKKVVVY